MTWRQSLVLALVAAVVVLCCGSSAFGLSGQNAIMTIAGTATPGFSGDGGPASSAQLSNPQGVAVDGHGDLIISDFGNQRLREVSPDGTITTLAGDGTAGFSGEGGSPASKSLVHDPEGVAVDAAGDIYFADNGNNRVREITAAGGISTVAGNGLGGYSGDGGSARMAQLNSPGGVAVDAAGNVYIADTVNNRIRKVTSDGTITTIAGTGTQGYNGDGIAATSAELTLPTDIAVDAQGNLYIADSGNGRVREVGPNGTIATIAGNGLVGSTGDGGPATSAKLVSPWAVALDATGNLYVVDYGAHRVRKVSGGTITALAGTGTPGFSGDGGPARLAQLDLPVSVAVDTRGDAYVADSANARIRKVSNLAPRVTFTATPVNGVTPLTVIFDDTGSVDPDGELLVQPGWDFGDGTTASADGRKISHTYVRAGTFTAKLSLRDLDGATGTATRTITVAPPNVAPSASFTATPATGQAPLKVRFDGSGSSDPDGSIRAYTWQFGDGPSGSGETTSHSYAHAGIFTATLTVTDSTGASASTSHTVTVRSSAVPALRLGGPNPQRLLTRRGITVTASCDRSCALSVTAVVKILHTRFALRLKGAHASLPAAGSVTLKLALSPGAQKRFSRLFKPGRRAGATVTVRATDAAGDASRASLRIAVRR